jgi:hypothetical protein
MAKYSEEYIASIKAGTGSLPADKGQATYVKRLARNYEPGVSRAQLRGHARAEKGEKPLSVVKQEKAKAKPIPAKGKPGKVAPPKPKPTIAKGGKAGRKNLGRHVQKQYNQQGEVRRTRVNARSTESLGRQLDRVSNNQGIILHFVTQDGRVIKAVSNGKNHTANAGDFKRRIADKIAAGASWNDAFFEAVGESFDLYDDDGGAVAIDVMSFTNVIMYAE